MFEVQFRFLLVCVACLELLLVIRQKLLLTTHHFHHANTSEGGKWHHPVRWQKLEDSCTSKGVARQRSAGDGFAFRWAADRPALEAACRKAKARSQKIVAGGAEDEYEETSLHPPAALSLPGDELLRAPSAASIVILPVSFAVQLRFATSLLLSHHCHLPSLHRLCRSLLTTTRSSKSLLISQVGESFFHLVQSGIIFSTQSEVVQNSSRSSFWAKWSWGTRIVIMAVKTIMIIMMMKGSWFCELVICLLRNKEAEVVSHLTIGSWVRPKHFKLY